MKKLIEIKDLSKKFDDTIVLKGVSLDINENEFVTLLGPSGCGKTTILRIIGGFLNATDGEVLLNGKNLLTLPAYKRPTNTVFQSYALFPHLDVFENVAFGLRIKNANNRKNFFERFNKKLKSNQEKDIKEKVLSKLKLVGLEGYENRSIEQLSGGQKQRVAIARALVNEPKVLLLDEPLAALDLKMRQEMQYELKDMQKKLGITFIFVTHDQEEALTMSDKIVVMNKGEIQQVGTPIDIYNEPVNRFVATFIGESNIIEGKMIKDELCHFNGFDFPCVDKGFKNNEEVDIVIRPEDIDILEESKGKIKGVVDSVIFKGVHYEIEVKTEHRMFLVHTTDVHPVGKKVSLTWEKEDIQVMEKEGWS